MNNRHRMDNAMRTCGNCHRDLPEDAFYRSKRYTRQKWCKDCFLAHQRDYRRAKRNGTWVCIRPRRWQHNEPFGINLTMSILAESYNRSLPIFNMRREAELC